MKNKYQLTPFSRLLLFLIFFSPFAYIGSKYYQGEDGLQAIKMVWQEQTTETTESQILKKKNEIKTLKTKLMKLEKELKELESQ